MKPCRYRPLNFWFRGREIETVNRGGLYGKEFVKGETMDIEATKKDLKGRQETAVYKLNDVIQCIRKLQQLREQLTGEGLKLVLEACGLEKKDIEAAWFSNTGWGMSGFQHSIRAQVALSANGLDKIPMINVENACASGSTALHSGWMAVKAGIYDCVLAIGAEKMYFEIKDKKEKAKSFQGFIAGTDVEETTKLIEAWKASESARKEKEAKEAKEKGIEIKKDKSKKGHSIFMDFYAHGARSHMKKYGTTQRQLAAIAAKAHNNSTLNPLAQYTFPQTVEQVMEDREVAFPLTRAMCAPI